MKPIDPNQPTIEMRYRNLLVLWFGISMSVMSFLAFVQFIRVSVESNVKLSLILNSVGILPVGLSFLLKQRILEQAISGQNIERVQIAYVLAWALCEMSALLGLVDHFVNGSPYYFIGFVFAILGMLGHFPRKQHLLDASQKQL